jgi:hypothetical protein
MKLLKALMLALTLSQTSAWAAGSSVGPITVLFVHHGDLLVFAAGANSGKPACSVIGDEWSVNVSTPTGKAMLAVLLSAQAQGKSVAVGGSGACTAWLDRETPVWIRLLP